MRCGFFIFAVINIWTLVAYGETNPISGVYISQGQATIRASNSIKPLEKATDCMVLQKVKNTYKIYVQSVQHLGHACYVDGNFLWENNSGIITSDDEKTGLKIILKNKEFSFLVSGVLLSQCGPKADWANVRFPEKSLSGKPINSKRLGESCPIWNR